MPTPQFEHVTYSDFSGGFTDDLNAGERHMMEKMDNFLLTNEKKPYSREGSQLIGGSNFLSAVQAYAPTGDLINYQKDTNLLIRAKDKLFVNTGASFSTGTWAALSGPNGNAAFPGLGNFSSLTWGEYDNHTYFVGWDSFNSVNSSPMKVYQHTDGSYRIRNAGLPKFPNNLDQPTIIATLNQCATLLSDLQSKMQSHFGNAGSVDHNGIAGPAVHTVSSWGSSLFYTTSWPGGVTAAITQIYNLYLVLRKNYLAHIEDARKSSLDGTNSITNSSLYHFYSGTERFGNFYLKPLIDPMNVNNPVQTLISLVPLLIELKRSWNMHVNSFFIAPVTGSKIHAGTVWSTNVSDPNPYPNPIFCGGFDANFGPMYTWLQNLRTSITTHVSDITLHNSADFTAPATPVIDIGSFLLTFYTMTFQFYDHRIHNTVHVAGSTEPHTTQHYPPSTAADDSLSNFSLGDYTGALQQPSSHTIYASAGSIVNTTEALYLLSPDTNLADAKKLFQNLFYLQVLWGLHACNHARHLTAGNFTVDASVLPEELFSAQAQKTGFHQDLAPQVNYQFEQRGYAFVYRNDYRVLQGFSFENESAPYQYQYPGAPSGLTQVLAPNIMTSRFYATVTLDDVGLGWGADSPYDVLINPTGLPAVNISGLSALPTTENWPTDSGAIDIYRAGLGLTTYQKVGSIAHNAGSFYDEVDESVLQGLSLPTLYTTGNDIAYDPPPQSRCMTIVNEVAYFGGTTEVAFGDPQIFPKRLRQSLSGAPDSCPATFFSDFDSDIKTLGAARGYPIVVCARGVYRIDGIFDALGRGGMNPIRISDTVGGIGPNAGATLNDRFYFAAPTGIFVTDGFQVTKLTAHLDKSFAALLAGGATATMKIKATVDRKNQRILWTAPDVTGYAQSIWVLDVRHSAADRGSFQRLTSGTNFAPLSVAIFKDTLYRGDEDGFVFAHLAGSTNDPKINRGTHALSGSTVAVPYWLRTTPDQLGYTHMRKWAPYAMFELDNLGTNVSLQVGSINDKNSANLRKLNPIRFRGEYGGSIRENRKFPGGVSGSTSGGVRCQSKQLDLQPANVILTNSDASLTKCHISGTSVSLDTVQYDGSTASSATFPADSVDQYLCLEDDGYVTQYLITAQPSASTLTLAVSPPASGLSRKWVLRGVPKNESVQVNQMSVWFFPMTQVQHPSMGSDGNNA